MTPAAHLGSGAPPSTHDRVVNTAVRLTVDLGWANVTMARLADEVGVSRQTVYNEIGSRPRLAEAMVLRELDRFLDLVGLAFDAHPVDLLEALRAASRTVLEAAHDNPLLRAVVSATHGADTELLPLLTTHAASLLETATAIVRERATPYRIGLAPDRLDVAIGMTVRLVLSHVMQPVGPAERTADEIAWIAGRVLGLDAVRAE